MRVFTMDYYTIITEVRQTHLHLSLYLIKVDLGLIHFMILVNVYKRSALKYNVFIYLITVLSCMWWSDCPVFANEYPVHGEVRKMHHVTEQRVPQRDDRNRGQIASVLLQSINRVIFTPFINFGHFLSSNVG